MAGEGGLEAEAQGAGRAWAWEELAKALQW